MLRFLSGKVVSVFDNLVVLDVNGFGFELLCTGRAAALCAEGEQNTLVTHLQFSESGPTLFGFANDRERILFLKLTTVKGVGGKMAMNILKAAPSERIVSWILSSDVDSMVKIPGVGRKTAERLCFEMRPQLTGENAEFPAEVFSSSGKKVDVAMEALHTLGFVQGEIGPVFRKLKDSGFFDEPDLTEEKIIRLALKELKRN
jgi:Holliday junction DNA helicase RuvA